MKKAKNITVDKELLEDIEDMAEEEHRKVSNMIEVLLKEAVDARKNRT